jgi:polyferredoxin
MGTEKTRGRPDMFDDRGARKFIHPTEVKGKFQVRRKWVRRFLIAFFLVLPWLRIGGEQALLIDIVHRKFSILGHTFFAQDVPMLFLVLIQFLLIMALLTALLGRFWCGWLCPQTVYIDEVFRAIERFVEGSAEERRKKIS